MKAIETTARVKSNGELLARVPQDVLPGTHTVILVLTDLESDSRKKRSFVFPVDHVGKWPSRLSLRRKDIYADNGR